jgi:dTDP-4-dehydrorhamnose 3,5-epimerase
MIFTKTSISDLIIIESNPIIDNRGSFQEIFRLNDLENELGYRVSFCQENQSTSKYGVLRGLHFQEKPYEQAKLIRVVQGSVLDVVVDLRKNSLTYGKYFSIELSHKNNLQLFIPKCFAHGYLTLSQKATIVYKTDNYYNKDSENGIKFDDEYLNINWGLPYVDIKCSEKDKLLNNLKNIIT